MLKVSIWKQKVKEQRRRCKGQDGIEKSMEIVLNKADTPSIVVKCYEFS